MVRALLSISCIVMCPKVVFMWLPSLVQLGLFTCHLLGLELPSTAGQAPPLNLRTSPCAFFPLRVFHLFPIDGVPASFAFFLMHATGLIQYVSCVCHRCLVLRSSVLFRFTGYRVSQEQEPCHPLQVPCALYRTLKQLVLVSCLSVDKGPLSGLISPLS